MSVEDEGMTSISFTGSRGTPARWHNSVIKIENGREALTPHKLCRIPQPKQNIRALEPSELFKPMFEEKHGHYVAKRNEKAEKNEEIKT
ncbi:hypothetical protein H5410_015559 [Solanum commersonii]|uniref:Uncharacterized protein n=1 Tax=Solanum commersonii TaxID=4109 RepID=A0A9J5ZUW5_SOLCO|nr:hypothetical protein H5410_015559 [Solanum commersonii]